MLVERADVQLARGVLAEMEANLASLRTDVDLVSRYQAQVFERQIEAEERAGDAYVSDRAFCNLAYAAQHSDLMAEVFANPRLGDYMKHVRGGIVFYLRPHQELLAEDGVRERVDWEEVLRIDGMVKMMLEMHAVPYLPVASLSMQERTRAVERVLSLAGLERERPRRRYLNPVSRVSISEESASTEPIPLREEVLPRPAHVE